MFRAVILFCAVLALTKGATTPVNRCISSTAVLPLNTYIAGCTAQPCELPQGQDAVVQIIFRAPYTMHTMRTSALAFLGGIAPLPYNLGEMSVTCNFLANTYCPVVKDEVIKYSLNMFIEDFMGVGTQLPIEFRIHDDSNRIILCIRVTVRITSPVSVGKLGARNATMTVEV